MSAQSLVNQGFYGYQGWGDQQADADFAATGGAGKGSSNSSNGSSNGQLSAPDLAKLSLQASGIIHPYYVELAKQAKGNFDEAIKLMQGDYTAGVKKAKEDNALAVKYGAGDLNNALATLGLNFNKENEKQLDTLNSRGMAVYQNNPDGTPNVVQTPTFNPSFDPNNPTSYNAGVSGPNSNQANLGRGGYEAEQARQDQQLRAEATMRAGMKPIEAAGLSLKQQTNPGAFNPNDPLNKNVDLSQTGSLERNLAGSYQPAKTGYLNTLQSQKAQENADINNIAQTYGQTQQKSIDANAQNQLQKQYNTDFVTSGLT